MPSSSIIPPSTIPIQQPAERKCTPARVRRCLRTFLAHLFSHIGLCGLVVGYSLLGAMLFEYLESDFEMKQRGDVKRKRETCIQELWKITEQFNVLYRDNWTWLAGEQLRKFEVTIVDATKQQGYDGKDLEDEDRQWSFSGALLYSVTVITTIGYGNIAPKTWEGRLVTIVYALFGVPLMLLCLSNIGTLMATTFQFAYSHCCSVFHSKKKDDRKASIRYTNWAKTDSHLTMTQDQRPLLRSGAPSEDCAKCSEACSTSSGMNTLSVNKCANRSLSPEVRKILIECAEYNLANEGDHESAKIVEEMQAYDEREDVQNDAYPPPPLPLDGNCCITPPPPPLPPDFTDVDYHFLQNYPIVPPPPHLLHGDGEECDSEHTSIYPDSSNQNTPSRVPLIRRNHHMRSDCDISCDYTQVLPPDGEVESVKIRLNDKPLTGNGEAVILTEPRNDRVPVWLVLMFVIGYICAGAVLFSTWEEWDFLDGAYFCFITLSTIGFGDLVPGPQTLRATSEGGEGHAQLVVCCLYLILGLAIIAMSFNLVQEEAIAKCKAFGRYLGILEEHTCGEEENAR